MLTKCDLNFSVGGSTMTSFRRAVSHEPQGRLGRNSPRNEGRGFGGGGGGWWLENLGREVWASIVVWEDIAREIRF
jgi:hypothetical protein